MAILDKLVEKKDVLAYIKFSTDMLKKELDMALLSAPNKDKQFIAKQFAGRVLELKELRKVVQQGMLKSKSISYSRKCKKMETSPKIIKETSPKIIKETRVKICDICHGKGFLDNDGDKLNDEGSEKCAKCNGTGTVSGDNNIERQCCNLGDMFDNCI
jgi:hypothetical protein